MKYRMAICFVCLLLKAFPFLARRIELLLQDTEWLASSHQYQPFPFGRTPHAHFLLVRSHNWHRQYALSCLDAQQMMHLHTISQYRCYLHQESMVILLYLEGSTS